MTAPPDPPPDPAADGRAASLLWGVLAHEAALAWAVIGLSEDGLGGGWFQWIAGSVCAATTAWVSVPAAWPLGTLAGRLAVRFHRSDASAARWRCAAGALGGTLTGALVGWNLYRWLG